MPAGMHPPRYGRGVVQPRDLLYRQRIHIGAQPDGRPVGMAIYDFHDTRGRDALMQFIDPEFPQTARDKRRRIIAVERQFGMRM